MAGNSRRRGAMRKPGSKKGPQVGSGGQRRKALEGRGPTPKASERPGHPAARRARAAERRSDRDTDRGHRSGRDVLVGRNPVVEALRAAVPASALHVLDRIEADARVREALALAANRGLAIMESSRAELDRLSGGAVHQGLVLLVPPYEYSDPRDLLVDSTAPLLVALDGVTDPRNLGALVRSAAAFGADGLIVTERRSAGVTGSAWKASAGALSRLRVARAVNLTRTLVDLKREGCMVVGLAADAPLTLGDLDPELARGPLVLVVGSEGRGLSRLVGETCDLLVGIPMASGQESLNAGVAGGIALYAVASLRSS